MDQGNSISQYQVDRRLSTRDESCRRENKDSGVHLVFKGIYIWHSKIRTEIYHKVSTRFDMPFLQMLFCIDDQRSLKGHVGGLNSESNCLFYVPKNTANRLHTKFSSGTEVMGVNIEMPLFFDLLPKDNKILVSLEKKIKDNEAVNLSLGFQPLTIAMKEVIHQILNCMRKDDCRCLFFHVKVVELLSLQLEQLELASNHASPPPHKLLKEEELKRVYRIKEIIEKNPQKKFSLIGLAHTVGTNDSTLKKHFKAVFGMTVFGYLHAFRMEQAKRYLLDTDMKISVIAQCSGYKYPTHFSAAFKKYFGYLPTQIKQS